MSFIFAAIARAPHREPVSRVYRIESLKKALRAPDAVMALSCFQEDQPMISGTHAYSYLLHTPVPDPREDEEDPDVKEPPVPPDQEPDVVPQRDPPKPGEHTPMIA